MVWDADNKIGNKGAKAIGDALAPRQNPDGSWVSNAGLTSLHINSEFHTFSCCHVFVVFVSCGSLPRDGALHALSLYSGCTVSAVCILHSLQLWFPASATDCVLFCHAANQVGDWGAQAIGDALAPRQNPDGSWVFNEALETLQLYSKSFMYISFSSLHGIFVDFWLPQPLFNGAVNVPHAASLCGFVIPASVIDCVVFGIMQPTPSGTKEPFLLQKH